MSEEAWKCVVCGLLNGEHAAPVDCATCRAARPGVAAREVPEDEAFRPVSFARVFVALCAILTAGVLVAREVRFLQRWGAGPSGHVELGTHLGREQALRRVAASLLSYTGGLRAGGDPDPGGQRLQAIQVQGRIGSGTGGPDGLVAAEALLARCVHELASLRVSIANGAAPDVTENELSRIERTIREAEGILSGNG
jgi:hypothetical protein